MRVYVLRKHVVCRPHGLYDCNIISSTNKKSIFKKAAQLSRAALSNKSSWEDITYWVEIFDNKLDVDSKCIELEFVNDRRESTFGKIVSKRGSVDQKILGTWYN